jgi:hypothetical protein
MTGEGTSAASTTSSIKPLPPVVLRVTPAERHLNADLLAVVRRRKLEQSVLPGVPFH